MAASMEILGEDTLRRVRCGLTRDKIRAECISIARSKRRQRSSRVTCPTDSWCWVRVGEWADWARQPSHDWQLTDEIDKAEGVPARHAVARVLAAHDIIGRGCYALVGYAKSDDREGGNVEWVPAERVVRPLTPAEMSDHLRGEPVRREWVTQPMPEPVYTFEDGVPMTPRERRDGGA